MRKQRNKPLPSQYQLSDYKILGVLSTGGFSIVYLAEDRNRSLVVIKEYVPANFACRQADEDRIDIVPGKEKSFQYGMKCFFQEGQALAKLSHSNIVRVLNFFRANGTVYLVLRYEEGQTLHRYIKIKSEKGGVKEYFLAKIFVYLLSGVRQLHAKRLLHLDIKPSNIYLRKNGIPILIDFGSCRQAFSMADSGVRNVPMYTNGYASPEQYDRRGFLGPWSDFYGIGASIYACMGRRVPQPANERVKNDCLVPAHKLFRGVYSDVLIDLVDRCLVLDYRNRPTSGYEIQKSLISLSCLNKEASCMAI